MYILFHRTVLPSNIQAPPLLYHLANELLKEQSSYKTFNMSRELAQHALAWLKWAKQQPALAALAITLSIPALFVLGALVTLLAPVLVTGALIAAV